MSGDGNLLIGWERSAGLRAPPAPDAGRLSANGTGYLLAIGPPSQHLYPRSWSVAGWLSALSVPVVAALPFLLVPAPYGLLGVAALGTLACWLPRAALGTLARARLARRLERAPRLATIAPEVDHTRLAGRLVRLEGVVSEQATVPSLFTGRPAVLAISDCAGVVETRGIDFDVRLADGRLVRVPARDAVLLGRPPRVRGHLLCGPLTLTVDDGKPRLRSALLSADGWIGSVLRFAAHELTLGPGDAVELCGAIDLEPDEETQRGFARGPALRPVLRPSSGFPVVVRKREST